MRPLQTILPDYFRLNYRIRDEQTRVQYRIALTDFRGWLQREPTEADLTDDNLTELSTHLFSVRKLAAKTVNERVGRLSALWTWLAKRGEMVVYPTFPRIPEPVRIPKAWTQEQLAQLMCSFLKVRGRIAGVRARDWWRTLHLVAWETGERIGALRQLTWSHLDGQWLLVPAEIRKGARRDMPYRLTAETVAELVAISNPERELIWPWPLSTKYLWTRYRELRRRAGLPTDRQSSFHRMRKSVASHAKAAGADPTDLLGHSDRRTTSAYIDPRIAPPPQPTDYLFRIG